MSNDANKFSLVWRITNFKSRIRDGSDLFGSPLFVSKYTEKSEWRLWFQDAHNECLLRLRRCDTINSDTVIYYNFNATIICYDGENIVSNYVRHGFTHRDSPYVNFPFSHKDILKNEKKYLNGECLTLLFLMWKDTGDAFDVIRMTAHTIHFKNISIQDQEHLFTCIISNFGEEPLIKKRIFIGTYEFLFKMYALEQENIVQVSVQNISVNKIYFKVDCSVFSSTSNPQQVKLEIQNLENSRNVKIFHFPNSSMENKLEAIKSNFSRNGILSLYFKVAMSWKDYIKSAVYYEFNPLINI